MGFGSRVIKTLTKTDSEQADPTSTVEMYLDGSLYQSFGTQQPHLRYDYGVTTDLGQTISASLVDGGTLRETTTSQLDFAGRISTMSYMDGASSSNTYNALGQLVKTTDADGVNTLYEYNAEGEQTTTIVDLNGNGVKDIATDAITFSDTTFHSKDGFIVARGFTSLIKPGETTFTEISRVELTTEGTRSWTTELPAITNPIVSNSVMNYLGNGNATFRVNSADGSYRIETTTAGLLTRSESFDSDDQAITHVGLWLRCPQTVRSLQPMHVLEQ